MISAFRRRVRCDWWTSRARRWTRLTRTFSNVASSNGRILTTSPSSSRPEWAARSTWRTSRRSSKSSEWKNLVYDDMNISNLLVFRTENLAESDMFLESHKHFLKVLTKEELLFPHDTAATKVKREPNIFSWRYVHGLCILAAGFCSREHERSWRLVSRCELQWWRKT